MTHKIVILDFATAEVHIFDYDENIWEDGEHFLAEHHSEHGNTFKESNCQWMIINKDTNEGRLPVYIH
jgi:hypothetical protein